jgi:acyl dehydratase
MAIDEKTIQLELTGSETLVEIKEYPSIKALFLKMFFLSMVRPSSHSDDIIVSKARIVLNNLRPDREIIQGYKDVCGFSKPHNIETNNLKTNNIKPDKRQINNNIPISYLQTLFIGLLGKFITTPYFPINPMGLIHIGQSFEQKRAITVDETLDLSCRLHYVTKTQKGIITQFLLEVMSDKKIVWQGISSFFTRNKVKQSKKERDEKKEETFLKIKETISVPQNMGRQYAGVSGDYNPHHLYWFTAMIFGFKQPIAHGMWSLARVIASLEKNFDTQYPLGVEAAFKLPIFMPASISLGYEKLTNQPDDDPLDKNRPVKNRSGKNRPDKDRSDKDRSDKGQPVKNQINFELRDKKKGLPHLKGQFYFKAFQ